MNQTNNSDLIFCYDYVFPNFVLPNATMPEFGLINYIVSMYSDKASNATFLEQVVSSNDLFEDSLGNGPNSRTGFFYQAQVYRPHINYKEESVYFNGYSGKKFIYPIKPNPDIESFMGVGRGNSNKIEGEFFWKFISKTSLEAIKRKQAIILIDYSMEPFITYEMHLNFHKCLEKANISANSIYLCVNSFNAKELYENWFPLEQRRYNVRNIPFCLDHSSWFFNRAIKNNTNECMSLEDFIKTKNKIRQNHFLMKIRNAREHRLALFYRMISNDLLKYGDWSFLPDFVTYQTSTIDAIMHKFQIENLDYEKIKKIHDSAPHYLVSEKDNSYGKVNAWTDKHFDAYLNSYIEICFETFVEGDSKSLTEKIFKPIINFQPFIFVAYPGALKLLKELGFKTFDGFINEAYDEEADLAKRMQMIYIEIEKICSMSIEEIHEWYWKMEDILIHNHSLLSSYHKKNNFGRNLLEEFINISNTNSEKFI